MNKKLSFFLFLIILISGYASLALELIAMRQVIPYIGNDTIISSIIIGIILVSLSLWAIILAAVLKFLNKV